MAKASPQEIERTLAGFMGGGLTPYMNIYLSEGLVYLGHAAECFWLYGEAIARQYEPEVAKEPFQVFILDVDLEQETGILRCEDGNNNIVGQWEISYTDFPLTTIKFYFTAGGDRVACLPREY